MNSDPMVRLLHLIRSNPKDLLPAGHYLLNRLSGEAFRLGLIDQAPHKAIAWTLTPKGKKYLTAFSD
jgi:hypothetical protein